MPATMGASSGCKGRAAEMDMCQRGAGSVMTWCRFVCHSHTVIKPCCSIPCVGPLKLQQLHHPTPHMTCTQCTCNDGSQLQLQVLQVPLQCNMMPATAITHPTAVLVLLHTSFSLGLSAGLSRWPAKERAIGTVIQSSRCSAGCEGLLPSAPPAVGLSGLSDPSCCCCSQASSRPLDGSESVDCRHDRGECMQHVTLSVMPGCHSVCTGP